jgi:hypothetical protein
VDERRKEKEDEGKNYVIENVKMSRRQLHQPIC